MAISQTSQHTEEPIHYWFVRTEETRKEVRTSGIPACESSRRRISRKKLGASSVASRRSTSVMWSETVTFVASLHKTPS